jgi:DNA-binding transcriptional ArsR family regulator
MSKASQSYIIQSKKQMAALKAPTRQEILDVLAPMGDASIAEIAVALGRPADSLYYHMRILQKSGLVLAAGERTTGTHREALFRTPAPDMRLAYEPGPKGNARNVTPIVDAMLRLTARDVVEGFQDERVVVAGDNRELWATRTTGWLTAQELTKVNRYIAKLRSVTTQSPAGNGQLFGLTMVLTPLNRSTEAANSPTLSLKNLSRKSTSSKKG